MLGLYVKKWELFYEIVPELLSNSCLRIIVISLLENSPLSDEDIDEIFVKLSEMFPYFTNLYLISWFSHRSRVHCGMPKGERQSTESCFGVGTRHDCSSCCSFQDCSTNGLQMAADGWYSEASAPPM